MKIPVTFSFVWVFALTAVVAISSAELRGDTQELGAEVATKLSPAASEVLKLVDAGVEQNVLLGFIGNSTNRFNLTAEDLIYLKDSGVPSEVTTAMLQRDQVIRETPVIKQIASQPRIVAPTTPAKPTALTLPPSINTGVPAVTYFYEALAPYGTWFQLEGSGWVWQPNETVKNPSWRPYLDDGRWVWTDHGWYWESDYPWGWAAFHYGRWQQMEKLGWVWFPDTVWAPSWVTWRYHDNYLGWAPLPPAAFMGSTVVDQPVVTTYDFGLPQQTYTFVHVHHVFVRNVRPHCLPPAKVKEFYVRCKVVNDFAPGHGHGVINRGVPIQRVVAGTGKHFQPAPLLKAPVDLGHRFGGQSPAFGVAQPSLRQLPNSNTSPSHHAPQPFTVGVGASPVPGQQTVAKPRANYAFPPAPITPAPPGSRPITGHLNSRTVSPMAPVAPMNQSPVVTPMNPVVPTPPAVVSPMNPFASAVAAPVQPIHAQHRSSGHGTPAVAPQPSPANSQPFSSARPSHGVRPHQESPASPPSQEQWRTMRNSLQK